MVSTDSGNGKKEIEESNDCEGKSSIPFDISTSRKELLSNETPQPRKGFPGACGNLPGRIKFLKLDSASAKFRRFAEERDEFSRTVASPSSHGIREHIHVPFPLGKDYDSEVEEEAQVVVSFIGQSPKQKTLEKKFSFASREEEDEQQRIVEPNQRWSGGILDFWDDISLAYLSLFCSFCVFGWNMVRLGFGNMYVHTATFILLCIAPFFIFNLAVVNLDSGTAQSALSAAGVVLCLFGLLYWGFWRMRMRKRFNLPEYNCCFGKPSLSDCTLWLCCCWCTLAQEVRTGNLYNVVEEKFCLKQMKENGADEECPVMSPLPREDRVRSGPSSPSTGRISMGYQSPNGKLPTVKEEAAAAGGKDEPLRPPSPLAIHRD